MASPVLPEHFQAVLLTESDKTLCQVLLKFIRLSVLIWRYHKYKYSSAGRFTPAFEAEICDSICLPEEEAEA